MNNQYLKLWQSKKIPAKKKTFAAFSLLLISVLLLTSVSYAWLILSTSPELTGVNTTIGANGNLEIALTTKEHLDKLSAGNMYEDETPLVLTTGDPYEDNILWGNIIDLEDVRYGLNKVVLRPSLPNILSNTLQVTNPLITVQYGGDGRILYEDNYSSVSGFDSQSQNFLSSLGQNYGVRVAGTPFDAELMTRIQTLSSSVQLQASNTLNKNTYLLMDVFYQETSNYTTADLRNLINNVSILHTEYQKTTNAIEGAFSGEIADEDAASLLEDIANTFDKAQIQLEAADTYLRGYEPPVTQEDPSPAPVALTVSQAKEILLPLFGEIIFYSKEPTEDGQGFQWVHHEDKSLNSTELRAELGKDSYFHMIGVLSGGYASAGEYSTEPSYATTTAEWTTVIDDFSQVFKLENESMSSKYAGYLAEYEQYSKQLAAYSERMQKVSSQEYEAEVDFFYEYTLYPLPDPKTGLPDETTQPFTPEELEAYVAGIDARIDELEQIIFFLEDYAKSAVMVYASSGILVRQTFYDVVAVDLAMKPLREYLKAADLMGNPNFAAIMEVCESAQKTIMDWRAAVAELEETLQPKDEDGNIIEVQKRDITVEDLLKVWDHVENMRGMTIQQLDYLHDQEYIYSADNFAEHANEVFVNTINRIIVPAGSGIYGILATELGQTVRDTEMPNSISSYAKEISNDTFRENSNTQYLPGKPIAIFAYSRGSSISSISYSRSRIYSHFRDVSDSDLFQDAYTESTSSINSFTNESIYDVANQILGDTVMERIISGESDGYSSDYYARLGTLLEDTKVILSLYEEAVARQILLYAAGTAAQETQQNAEIAENPTQGSSITKEANDLYTEALTGWESGEWSFTKLCNAVSASKNEHLEHILSKHTKLLANLDAAQNAYAQLSNRPLTWDEIYSVLYYFTEQVPEELIRRDSLISSTNGGIFADAWYVVNQNHSLDWWESPNEEKILPSTYVINGLPFDVDSVYSDIGLLDIDTELNTDINLETYNALALIEYLIDRTEDAQEHTISDREFVFNNSMLHMDSAKTQANRYYEEYISQESDLLHLLYRCALADANITPSTDDQDVFTYTPSDITSARDALLTLTKAVDTSLECVEHTLRAKAASASTSTDQYESAIASETVEEIMSAMNLQAGDVIFDLYANLSTLKIDIGASIDALNALLEDYTYWNNTATDVRMEDYLTNQVFSYIAPVQNLKINNLSISDFRGLITDLDAPYVQEDEDLPPITVKQMLSVQGVSFTLDIAAISTAHSLFETVNSLCSPYQASPITIGTAEQHVSDIAVSLRIDCVQTGSLGNSVSWAYSAGAPRLSSASSLNSNSNYIIADTYAVAVDFLLRTNAVASNLLLQTEGIQRIYTENIVYQDDHFDIETIEEMSGGGSYIQLHNDDPRDKSAWAVLENPESKTDQIITAERRLGGDIVKSIRIVFADTLSGQVYAYAGVRSLFFDSENHTITGDLKLTDELGYEIEDMILKPMTQNQVSAITAWIYLDGNLVNNSKVNTDLLGKLNLNLQFTTDAYLQPAIQNFGY